MQKSIFEQLIEIKTWKKNLLLKAVYLEKSDYLWWWNYFVYYYDVFTHSFYINDINREENRTSAINIIEHILNKAYKIEMNSFVDIIKKIQANKTPNVYNIYKNKADIVVIDKISFSVEKDKKWRIINFRLPKWEISQDKSKNIILQKS